MSRSAVIIGGPTACGKSRLGVALAEAFHGTVINADSMQVYRDLPVLTSQPREEDRRRAPHRLFGVLSAREPCSAGRWRALAVGAIQGALEAGRLPIVVGGTGLYLKVLREGIAPVPEIPREVGDETRARQRRGGTVALHRDLAARDPEMAARLSPGDGQRIIRAVEVIEATGRSLADWQRMTEPSGLEGIRFATICFHPPRQALYAACDDRFRAMVEEGALEEVRALGALALEESCPVLRALGVAELRAYLSAELGLEQAIHQAQGATRRYAKRQMTWFRHQLAADATIDSLYDGANFGRIAPVVDRFLLTENA
ncbi:MAG: tRNA (adenosine(37)-N6)-dimethylallyltransferase MiaA [Alphaproteobacteria bacterium]